MDSWFLRQAHANGDGSECTERDPGNQKEGKATAYGKLETSGLCARGFLLYFLERVKKQAGKVRDQLENTTNTVTVMRSRRFPRLGLDFRRNEERNSCPSSIPPNVELND